MDSALTCVEVTVRADAPINIDSVGVLGIDNLIGGVILDISRGSNERRACARTRSSPVLSSWERIVTAAPKLADKIAACRISSTGS